MSASCPNRCLFGRPRDENVTMSAQIASELEDACRKTVLNLRRRFNFDLEELRPTKAGDAGESTTPPELKWTWEVIAVGNPSKPPIPLFYLPKVNALDRSISVKKMQPSSRSQHRESRSRVAYNDARENTPKPRITQTRITDTWQVRVRRISGVHEGDREVPCKPLPETKLQDAYAGVNASCGSPELGSNLLCRSL
ncbi:unnamed protein product [Schistocephalus solidus]|uniref:Cyclin-dependent kinase inhibitor domain-containing protein n=1 Tax=Schistocephalus solidus TaxID=70667 RepID=A0A183TLQ2_SCHSO|nr:unnamed protein product [Schistocephalus solidus]